MSSTAYGSNADRLKKAMANHTNNNRPKAASVSHHQQPNPVQYHQNSRISSCSSSSSESTAAAFHDSVAHLIPYIHSSSPSTVTASSTATAATRRSTASSSNATTISSDSLNTNNKSPKRLFERHNTENVPNMVTTQTSKNNLKASPEPYELPPSTPVLDDKLSSFTNYVYEHEELSSTSDIFLPMRIQALNLDLDNVIHDALVSTAEKERQQHQQQQEALDTMSTTSSRYSRVLNYEQFDYPDVPSVTDSVPPSSPSKQSQDEKAPSRKQTINLGSKMKKFAKKITV